MAAEKNNKYWKKADPSKIGRPARFENPLEYWTAVCKYIEWVEENPMKEEKLFHYQGQISRDEINLMRPYTWEGFYAYLGTPHLDYYKEKKDFLGIIKHVDNVFRNQKFSGAAVGLFNSNIIARDLGLKEKTENETNLKLGYQSSGITIGFVDENGKIVEE